MTGNVAMELDLDLVGELMMFFDMESSIECPEVQRVSGNLECWIRLYMYYILLKPCQWLELMASKLFH